MGTLVSLQVVPADPSAGAAIDRAFGWFHEIEARCTRFREDSELMRLAAQPGIPVAVSAILYQAVNFALQVAAESQGAFDPTVGHHLHARGFNREHRTGETAPTIAAEHTVTYRDVQLDPDRRTITLLRPLLLDLGAVAKGLAIDLAARELQPFRDFAIDAGGDLYLGGLSPSGEPWAAGIRHPRRDGELIASLRVSNRAVCTSGDYERRDPTGGHHILHPHTGTPAHAIASATVVAEGAMLADALATAAFVMGPAEGIALLDRMGVAGLLITPDLQRYQTRGLPFAA